MTIIRERGQYWSFWTAAADLGSLIFTTTLIALVAGNLWDWFTNLPDPAAMGPEAYTIYINTNPWAWAELIFSKRSLILPIPIAAVWLRLKYAKKWEHARLHNWKTVFWWCRVTRWFTASSLMANWLLLGPLKPLSEYPFGTLFEFVFGLVIRLSRELVEIFTAFWIMFVIIFCAALVLGSLYLGLRQKCLQFVIVGTQAAQFLVLAYAGLFAERIWFAMGAFFGAMASIIQVETFVEPLPEGYAFEKTLGAAIAYAGMLLMGAVSFYMILWPYFTLFGVTLISW